MAVGRHGFAAILGNGAKIGGLVAEVRVTQESLDRNRNPTPIELRQDVVVDIGAADTGMSEEAAFGLGKELAIDVDGDIE